jgi:hypothetical protein
MRYNTGTSKFKDGEGRGGEGRGSRGVGVWEKSESKNYIPLEDVVKNITVLLT